ncbi:NYN domain-containing protein [Pseudogemmobacter bohemicus]|uniref:NYN domain-containing protein n=1 Tax=Pseudogemmobacter bohemicus TaxID=2250708 RepID=UPI000DD32C09|nr:NYN domain-containing protein [Pseudogemmobacter bohemicus]
MTGTVCILVDGDNISAKHAAAILQKAKSCGGARIARVYMDAQRISDWHSAAGFRLVHAGTGKNAADLLLTVDAIEFLFSLDIKNFLIASSDGDFTHLAARLRERGATVIGAGEAKAPQSFRASCLEFLELGQSAPTARPAKQPSNPALLDLQIRSMIATHSKKGAGMRIAELAPRMHSQHGVRISTLAERTWRAYLVARPMLYSLDPRGPDAMVRFRPDGFAAT